MIDLAAVVRKHLSSADLCGPLVLPARCDVSDDAGVTLLAHVEAIHLDDALPWVEAGDSGHSTWCETNISHEGIIKRKIQLFYYSMCENSQNRFSRSLENTVFTPPVRAPCLKYWFKHHKSKTARFRPDLS